MFGLIGFDVKTLSDDALLEKLLELQEKLVWASKFGSADLLNQLQAYIAIIDNEMRTRSFERVQADYFKATKATIESDPDFKTKEPAEAKPSQESPARPVAIQRSDKPILPKGKT